MKKILLFLIIIFFTKDIYSQVFYYTKDDSIRSEMIDLGEGNSTFAFIVPSTFDGDSVTIKTYWQNYNKNLFKAGKYEGELLKEIANPGDLIVLPPYKYFYLKRFVVIESNDTSDGTDLWEVWAGKYKDK